MKEVAEELSDKVKIIRPCHDRDASPIHSAHRQSADNT